MNDIHCRISPPPAPSSSTRSWYIHACLRCASSDLHVKSFQLVGYIGGNVLSVTDPADSRSVGILFASLFFQGLGFFMAYVLLSAVYDQLLIPETVESFFFLALYIFHVFQDGLLLGVAANAAFVTCGPPGFTAAALILLSGHARTM